MQNKALIGFGLGIGIGFLAFTQKGRGFVAYSSKQCINEFKKNVPQMKPSALIENKEQEVADARDDNIVKEDDISS